MFELKNCIRGLFRRSVALNLINRRIKKGDVELPNDLSGIIYKEYDESGTWKYKSANELEESGYEIDYKSIR